MKIASILTAAAVVIIAATVPNVGAVQWEEYPTGAQHDATPPLDGPGVVEGARVLTPEHGDYSALLAGDVLEDQGVRSLGWEEEGGHLRGGPSSVPLVQPREDGLLAGLLRGANHVSDEEEMILSDDDEMLRDLHHIETVEGILGNIIDSDFLDFSDEMTDEMKRDLHHFQKLQGLPGGKTADILVFEECIGRSKSQCLRLIKRVLTANPRFMKVASFSEYIVEALRSRNYTDLGYNLVSLRTNYAETHVVGVLGDGMVFHPFPWCDVDGCRQIGPWDCDIGRPLKIAPCCRLIINTVTTRDISRCPLPLNLTECRGRRIACYVDKPYGSVSKPLSNSRIVMHLSRQGKVLYPAMLK